MKKLSLIFIFLFIAPFTFGWFTKEFLSTKLQKMLDDKTFKNVKHLTHKTYLDWEDMNRGVT